MAVAVGLWDVMAREAAEESALWGASLRSEDEREREPIFSPLGVERFSLGLETIYEGYLLHYGRPRLFAPADDDTALLLGDYLYAHGVARISALHGVAAVADLSELISLCSQLRAEEADGDGDGEAWAATAALLGANDGLAPARAALRDRADAGALALLARDAAGPEAVERALAAHRERLR